MLVSNAMVTSSCRSSVSNVIHSQTITKHPVREKSPKLASGTNVIGILTQHRIDLRVEWHSASFTPFNLFFKKKKRYLSRILKHHLKVHNITIFID